MKGVFKYIILVTILASHKICNAQLCSGTKVILKDTIVNDGNSWLLEFEDNFDSNTLDLDKWKLSESSQGSFDGSGAYNTLDNVIVSSSFLSALNTSASGVCQIVVKKENVTRPAVSWDPNSPVLTYKFTSSNIVSKEEFGWGKYEIRCKVPKGKGFFPAFWMYGEQRGEGSEIDVFEFMNEKNIWGEIDPERLSRVNQMHYHKWDKTGPPPGIDHNCGNSLDRDSEIDFSLDYHIFTVTWDRWAINWYIDGRLIKSAGQWYDINGSIITQKNLKPMQVALRNDWYPKGPLAIIVNFAVQSGENEPDDTTPFPSSLDIDYIRYYKSY